MTMGTEGNDTVIRLTMNWKSPFSLTLSPYPTTLEASGSKENYSFQANHVTLTFDYVTRIGAGEGNTGVSGNLNGSSIFSGTPKMERIKNKERNIWQYQMTLPLNETGRYYGCHAGWDGNTLVLRFNQAPQNGSLSGMNIVVDPGHGGKDTGNMAGRDVIEKNVNLLYAQEVAAALESRGANVVFTRTGDETVSLDQRTAIAHANNADLFISCHQNSAGANGAPHGVQVYYNAPFSQPLAQYVQAQLAPLMGDSQWNCWRGPYPQYNFVVTRERQYPSILIEFGFLSNLYDEGLAQDQSHRQAMAEAVAEGVVQYYASRN